MTTLNRKNISVALLLIISVFFSFNTHAAETTSLEHSISKLVIAQGMQVMSDLTEQLQQSTSAEINNFTIDFSFDQSIADSLAWINSEQNTASSFENENSEVETK